MTEPDVNGGTQQPGRDGIDDEEYEKRLLAPFLYGAPDLLSVEEGSLHHAVRAQHLKAWLMMVTGREWHIGSAAPATNDGVVVYVPPTLPGPDEPRVADHAYRVMALLQAEIFSMGFFSQREWLRELHQDWVLQVCSHLLMAHAVVARWPVSAPGMMGPLATVTADLHLSELWVGRKQVPSVGLPAPFCALLAGLTPIKGAKVDWVTEAVEAVQSADSTAIRLVLPGVAQRLRESFRSARLGAPPVPFWVGALHPGWFLEDAAGDAKRANEWRSGPKPLQKLLRRIRAKEVHGEVEPGSRFQAPPLVPPGTEAARYNEWDHVSGRYRIGFARIIEADAPTGPAAALEQIIASHRMELAAIRAEFAALKIEQRWLHGQAEGSELDMDRVIQAAVGLRAHQSPDPNHFLRLQHEHRPLAVLTLVDLSGSTQGSVLAQQQRAVVLFAEALRTLGVVHAFYGFSSEGAQACHFLRIRDWADDETEVAKRMGSLMAGGGSRLGAHIRHATAKLMTRSEEDRLLLILSDGRPEDRDGYRGQYGIADSALAVREAGRSGIHIHCVSMDSSEGAYLRTIFGPRGYTVVPSAEHLARRLPMVFRSLSRR